MAELWESRIAVILRASFEFNCLNISQNEGMEGQIQGRKLAGFECRINLNTHKVTYTKPSGKEQPNNKKPRRESYQHVQVEYIGTLTDSNDPQQSAEYRVKSPPYRNSHNRKKSKTKATPKSPQTVTRSRISEFKERQVNMLQLERKQKRTRQAVRKQKQSRQLKQLIELGNREQRILLELYNLRVRQRNQSKSKSPSPSLSERLSWGSNQQRIDEHATKTLRRICLSMRSLKGRSNSLCDNKSQRNQQARPTKYSSKSPQNRERGKRRRVVVTDINRPTQQQIPDEQNLEDLRRRQRQNLLNSKATVIQRFFRNRKRRKQMLQLLHLLYHPKPPRISTAVNTQPFQLMLPAIPAPRADAIAALRSHQLKLIQQKYQLLVQTRQTEQLQLEYVLERQSGVATNLHVINENIICLIKYLIMYYEDELLEEVKEPYGSKAVERIRALNGYDMDEYDPYTISEEIFTEFEQNVIDSLECSNPESKVYEHTHNKALFDAFNEAINRRRSYYDIEGEPFPWTKNTRTVRMHRQANLKELLDECLKQILRDARTLAGLHIEESQPQLTHMDFDNYIEAPLHPNPYVSGVRDEKISKLITAQLQQEEPSWFWVENERAEIMFTLSEDIFDLLCSEIVRVLAGFAFRR